MASDVFPVLHGWVHRRHWLRQTKAPTLPSDRPTNRNYIHRRHYVSLESAANVVLNQIRTNKWRVRKWKLVFSVLHESWYSSGLWTKPIKASSHNDLHPPTVSKLVNNIKLKADTNVAVVTFSYLDDKVPQCVGTWSNAKRQFMTCRSLRYSHVR